MTKIIIKILSWLDNHQKETIIIAFLLSVLSGMLYLFFHTTDYGYSAQVEDNIFGSFFSPLMIMLMIPLYKVEDARINKRTITYFYLLVLLSSLCEVVIGLLFTFGYKLSFVAITAIFLPLFIFLIYLLYKTRVFYKELAIRTGKDIKLYFRFIVDSLKKK